jgi:hypothetical protein
MKKKSYTLKEKLEGLQKLRANNGNISMTALDLQITRKMLRNWRKDEDKMLRQNNIKTTKRMCGESSPKWPELEKMLVDWVNIERGERKRIISTYNIRDKAFEVAEELSIPDFKASMSWLMGFKKRNHFSFRKITSFGQEDNRRPQEIKETVLNYFETFNHKLNSMSSQAVVYNMDETPIYIDMMQSRTLSFTGEKNTEAYTTGNLKTKISVVIAISSEGTVLRGMAILKGLKKPPKCHVPNNLFVATSESGNMDQNLMLQWIRACLNDNGPFEDRKEKLLILDTYKSHYTDKVMESFRNSRIETVLIPPKTTSFLQPLDVLINSSFKAELKRKWQEWLANGPKEYTNKGYRRRPSWEYILNAIADALKQITPEMASKAFRLCGTEGAFNENNTSRLNNKLQDILNCNEIEDEELDFENLLED